MKKALTIILSMLMVLVLVFQISACSSSSASLKEIKLDTSNLSLQTGQVYDLKVTLTPKNAAEKLLEFSSSDVNIATVDENGKITGVTEGTAEITVLSSSNSKITAKCAVTVTKAEPTSAPILEGPLDISLLIPQNPSLPAFGETHLFYKEILEKFKVKLNVISVIGADYETKKSLMLASGELPDIFFDSTKNLAGYMEDGIVIDLKALIGENGPDIGKVLKDKLALYMCTDKNGKVMGVPEINQAIWTNGLMYRRDWVDKLGLKLPTTMDELYLFLKTIKEKDPAGGGKTIPFSTRDKSYIGITESITGFKNGRSVAWDIYEKKFVCGAISLEYKAALEFLNKLYAEGLIDNEFATTATQQWQQKVSSGNVAVTYDNLSRFYVFSYMFKAADPNTKQSMELMPPIADAKGNQYTQMFNGIAGASNIMTGTNVRLFAITKANKYPAESVKFLNHFFTEVGARMSNIGVEGVTYKTENGKISPLMSPADMSSKFYTMGSSNWPGYKTWEAIDMLAGTAYDPIKNYVKSFGNDITIEPPVVLSSDNADTVKEKLAIIDTYVEECRIKFIMGQMSFDEWDTYTKRIGVMGVDEVIRLYNEELARLNAL